MTWASRAPAVAAAPYSVAATWPRRPRSCAQSQIRPKEEQCSGKRRSCPLLGVERVGARTKIWSAGVQASPLGAMLAAQAGVTPTRSGQVAVEPDCTLRGHPEVFVAGDLMSLSGLPGPARGHDPVGTARGSRDPAAPRRRCPASALPVPRPRQPCRGLALIRHRRAPRRPRLGIPRLADLGCRPPHLPDRLQEPVQRALPLDDQLLRALAPRTDDHRPADLRPSGARRVHPRRRFR